MNPVQKPIVLDPATYVGMTGVGNSEKESDAKAKALKALTTSVADRFCGVGYEDFYAVSEIDVKCAKSFESSSCVATLKSLTELGCASGKSYVKDAGQK